MQQDEDTFFKRKQLLQIFSIHFGKEIIKNRRPQTEIFREMALCGYYLLLDQHSAWLTSQTNHALQDVNGHSTV